MERIASFNVDHTKLDVGMYTSRADGDIVTYDVRMVKPNSGVYLSQESIHTIEHLFASFVRSTVYSDNIIYVGPMGCRTGFYFIVRDTISPGQAIALVKQSMEFISDFFGDIPGTSIKECGNYLEHDLASAKQDVIPVCNVLQNYKEENLEYIL